MTLLLLCACVIGFWFYLIPQVINSTVNEVGCGGGILLFVLVDAFILRTLYRRMGNQFSWYDSIHPPIWVHLIAMFITGSAFVVLLLLVKLLLV
jgi:hypothetical protein